MAFTTLSPDLLDLIATVTITNGIYRAPDAPPRPGDPSERDPYAQVPVWPNAPGFETAEDIARRKQSASTRAINYRKNVRRREERALVALIGGPLKPGRPRNLDELAARKVQAALREVIEREGVVPLDELVVRMKREGVCRAHTKTGLRALLKRGHVTEKVIVERGSAWPVTLYEAKEPRKRVA